MEQVIVTDRLPIKSWVTGLEISAQDQAENIANLPFAFKHIALMPDAHAGYGMPIGGVLATHNVIIPNAVGKDIGCGMIAVKTDITTVPDQEQLKTYMGLIRQEIPVGFSKRDKPLDIPGIDLVDGESLFQNELFPVCVKNSSNAHKSLGTLGGGNHFIEIQKDKENGIWVMIHSGSRNLGSKVADHYHDLAVVLNSKWYSNNVNKELAFFPLDSNEGMSYYGEMSVCVDYAELNRQLMMEIVLDILGTNAKEVIKASHNYASLETHFGEKVVVHRKGAISAREGEYGIIPGSQGTKSYIVKGKGNPDSFMSSSHGAGRVMGRNQAKKNLDLAEQQAILDNQGIVHGIRSVKDLDEASGAYKDIQVVMSNQEDLTEIVYELQPLCVIKG